MVARRWPLFINATAICMAIVVFPEPPFSFPTTMTWGEPCDLTTAFSMAAPRNKWFHERQLPTPSLARTTRSDEVKPSAVVIERTLRGRYLFLKGEFYVATLVNFTKRRYS